MLVSAIDDNSSLPFKIDNIMWRYRKYLSCLFVCSYGTMRLQINHPNSQKGRAWILTQELDSIPNCLLPFVESV